METKTTNNLKQLTNGDCFSESWDLILNLDNHKFNVDKATLSRHSPVFKDTFAQDESASEIDLSGRTAHTVTSMRVFLRELYGLDGGGGQDLPSPIILRELLPLAHFYDCAALMRRCYSVIENRENPLVELQWMCATFPFKLNCDFLDTLVQRTVVKGQISALRGSKPTEAEAFLTGLRLQPLVLSKLILFESQQCEQSSLGCWREMSAQEWELVSGNKEPKQTPLAYGNPRALQVGARIAVKFLRGWNQATVTGVIAQQHNVRFDKGAVSYWAEADKTDPWREFRELKFQLSVQVKTDDNKDDGPAIKVTLRTDHLIGDLRRELAECEYIKHPMRQLRMVYQNHDLYPEEWGVLTMKEAGFDPHQTIIYCYKLPDSATTARQGELDSVLWDVTAHSWRLLGSRLVWQPSNSNA